MNRRTAIAALGVALFVVGLVIVAGNYSSDYDCVRQMMCHADGGLTPTTADRLSAALGFGSEQRQATKGLPSPAGAIGLLAGAAVVVAAAFVGRRERMSVAVEEEAS